MKFVLIRVTLKGVSLLLPHYSPVTYPLFRQTFFELENIMDDPKFYMNTNKDDSDRTFYNVSGEESNVLTQDEKLIYVLLQIIKFHHW